MGQVEISNFYSSDIFSFRFYAIVAALKRALRIEETNEEKEFRYSLAGQEFAVGVVMRRSGGSVARKGGTCIPAFFDMKHDLKEERAKLSNMPILYLLK